MAAVWVNGASPSLIRPTWAFSIGVHRFLHEHGCAEVAMNCCLHLLPSSGVSITGAAPSLIDRLQHVIVPTLVSVRACEPFLHKPLIRSTPCWTPSESIRLAPMSSRVCSRADRSLLVGFSAMLTSILVGVLVSAVTVLGATPLTRADHWRHLVDAGRARHLRRNAARPGATCCRMRSSMCSPQLRPTPRRA